MNYKFVPSSIEHLHEILIGPCPVFVKKAIESLFIDSSLWELNLGVLTVRCIDNGCAANLSQK